MSGLNGATVSMAMVQAELAQLRKKVEAAMLDRETYVRLTACLAKAITTGAKVAVVEGNVCVPKAAFE